MPALGRFLTADTIVPDPGNPQSYNRYSYVLNNPIILVDPTGNFTEDAIQEHIYNSICYMSWSCFEETFAAWQADQEWWDMLLHAQAGDVIVGSVDAGYDKGGFWTFSGDGDTHLDGIFWSDPYGEPRASDWQYGTRINAGMRYNLNDLFSGVDRGITWTGLIRWHDQIPSFYVRESAEFLQKTTSNGVRTWTSRLWNFAGFFLGLAVPKGGVAIGISTAAVTPSIDAAWLDVNGMQDDDVKVYMGDHLLIFHGDNGTGYQLRRASYAFDYQHRLASRIRYWEEN